MAKNSALPSETNANKICNIMAIKIQGLFVGSVLLFCVDFSILMLLMPIAVKAGKAIQVKPACCPRIVQISP